MLLPGMFAQIRKWRLSAGMRSLGWHATPLANMREPLLLLAFLCASVVSLLQKSFPVIQKLIQKFWLEKGALKNIVSTA